jgi:hypothetical protein
MRDDTLQTSRISIWNSARPFIVTLGHALHGMLDHPEVSIYGRDLHSADEGVGIQFQYVHDDPEHRGVGACYVVDVQIIERQVSLAWQVTTATVLAHPRRGHVVQDRQSYTLPLHDRARLRDLFRDELTPAARSFLVAAVDQPSDPGSITVSVS